MSEKVGRFTLLGNARQNSSIRAMALKASEVYGDRLAPNINVEFLPAERMPKRADGGPSVGYTPSFTKIQMWERVRRYDAPATFAHEIGHALPMSRTQKRQIEALADPPGGQWNAAGYADDVRETGARAQSRANLGVPNPPYKRFYTHDIPMTKDAEVAAIYKAPAISPEPDPVPPQPTPPDPAELIARIADLEAEVEGLEASLLTLNAALTEAQLRITAKDQKMTEGLAI